MFRAKLKRRLSDSPVAMLIGSVSGSALRKLGLAARYLLTAFILFGLDQSIHLFFDAWRKLMWPMGIAALFVTLLAICRVFGSALIWGAFVESLLFVYEKLVEVWFFAALLGFLFRPFFSSPWLAKLAAATAQFHLSLIWLPAISSGLAVMGFLLFVEYFLFSLGFPLGTVSISRRFYSSNVLRWGLINITVAVIIAASMPHHFLIPTLIYAALRISLALWTGFTVGERTYAAAEVAFHVPFAPDRQSLWAAHVTDVHLTVHGQRVEGGSGGKQNLSMFVNTIRPARPAFLFLTGDLTDHGNDDEWTASEAVLKPLAAQGCRILAAPGNHDLMAAYSSIEAWKNIRDFYGQNGQTLSATNGRRMLGYLEFVGRMDSKIKISNGRYLRDVIEWEVKLVEKAYELAQQVRAATLASDDSLPIALQNYGRAFAELKAYQVTIQVEPKPGETPRFPVGKQMLGIPPDKDFVDHLYDDLVRSRMRTAFLLRKQLLEDMFLWYAERWYDYFPLATEDTATDSELFVMNSIPHDISLFGSAWGYVNAEQLKSLYHAISSTSAKRIIVLVHHAPFRWSDEPHPRSIGDIQRWACLAVSNEVPGILAAARVPPVLRTGQSQRAGVHPRDPRINQVRIMSSKLLAIKIRRRLVAAAIFAGQELEHVECLHLCDEPEAVTDSVARFLARIFQKFRPGSAAIGLGSAKMGQRVKELVELSEKMLRSEIISIWKVEDRLLLESYALPKLKSKRQLKAIVESFWPQLEQNQLLAFEAAALGLYVQTERLLSYQ